MKPAPFTYHRPRGLREALATLADVGGHGKVLAGGQSLVPLLSMRLAAPEHVVDVNAVPGLDGIEVGRAEVRVGALARHADLEHHEAATAAIPLLRQALRYVAHPTIRNRGTVVGSICHADPAAELPAVLALSGGRVVAESVHGVREVPAAELYVGPLETCLRPDELATAVVFPVPRGRVRSAMVEVARRNGDYAVCGVAALVRLDDAGGVEDARAAYVSVGEVPPVLDLSEPLRAGGVDAAAAYATGSLECEGDIHAGAEYRRHLVGVLTARALRSAVSDDGWGPPSGSTPQVGTPAVAGTTMGVPSEGGQTVGVTVRVNGVRRDLDVPARMLLSDLLRHELRLTGTHVGCEHGVCGACTVLLDGRPVRSCLLLAGSVDGHEVTTVEGLASADGTMHPVQQAFQDCHGLQCGFCTPGFLTTIAAYLRDHPAPTEDEAREAISGNLCRCTGYQNIVRSVLRAAELMP
ncbi:MAG TPA: FAD binding domain-containing protein [Streptosporangiales bacterium]